MKKGKRMVGKKAREEKKKNGWKLGFAVIFSDDYGAKKSETILEIKIFGCDEYELTTKEDLKRESVEKKYGKKKNTTVTFTGHEPI
jgi:hypothetical protein